MMNPWLLCVVVIFLIDVVILLLRLRGTVKPVTDAEWQEWQAYCKEYDEKRNARKLHTSKRSAEPIQLKSEVLK